LLPNKVYIYIPYLEAIYHNDQNELLESRKGRKSIEPQLNLFAGHRVNLKYN